MDSKFGLIRCCPFSYIYSHIASTSIDCSSSYCLSPQLLLAVYWRIYVVGTLHDFKKLIQCQQCLVPLLWSLNKIVMMSKEEETKTPDHSKINQLRPRFRFSRLYVNSMSDPGGSGCKFASHQKYTESFASPMGIERVDWLIDLLLLFSYDTH